MRSLTHIVSPYGLAMISYAFFLFSCLIPPSVYEQSIHEPDFMFLDPATILFYTLCVAAFLVGLGLVGWLFPSVSLVDHKLEPRVPPAAFLLIPLILCVALSSLSSVLLVKDNPLAIPLLLTQQGTELQGGGGSALQLKGTFNISNYFMTGVIWWTAWRYYQVVIRRRGKFLVKMAMLLAILAVFIASSLNVSRHLLVLVFVGLVVSQLLRKAFSQQLNWKLVGKTALIFGLGGAFFFFFISALRGKLDWNSQIDSFIGYSSASYNRLAALLHGDLHFEYSGRGIYFGNFLPFNHTFNRIIPYQQTMSIPDSLDWWKSEFSSVGMAGLNSTLIFCGAFGEIYNEIGWMAPLYMLFYGLVCGIIWLWMKGDRIIGILLYPYCAHCILFWFATNALFDQDFVALIVDAVILSIYEFLLISKTHVLIPVLQAD